MIEINLLSEELKVKNKTKNPEKATVKGTMTFNQDQLFIYAILAVLALFILLNFFLVILTLTKNGQLVSLNRKWQVLEPEKKALDEFDQEFSSVFQDAGLIQSLTRQRILWEEKLNALSLCLPSGVWFTEISLNSKNITIHGSVISLEKQEVALINKLLENLKADSYFFKDFLSFELSNVQKKNIGGYDIADFALIGVLKSR